MSVHSVKTYFTEIEHPTMKFLKILFQIVLFLTALISIVPHLFPDFWFTDIFAHFKLQYLIVLMFFLLPVVLYPAKKKFFPIVFILFLIIWNTWFIFPLYIQNKELLEKSGGSLSMLSINLLASNTNHSEAVQLITDKDPDIVIFLELSPQWNTQLQQLYPRFSFRQMIPQNDNFGIGIMSKIPMISEVTILGKDFPPSIHGEIQINGKIVSILATHPVPPVGREQFELRNEQLSEVAKLSASEPGNFILAGDLNTSSYSSHFQNLKKNGNLKDSRTGFGINSTWPTNIYVMRTTLDHILYKGEMKIFTISTEKSIGSDHLPVYVEFGF